MTTVKAVVNKANVQAVIAMSMVGLVAYGFIADKLTSEAILPIAGAAILYFFPRQPEK